MGWLWEKFGIATAFHTGAVIALAAALGLMFAVNAREKFKQQSGRG